MELIAFGLGVLLLAVAFWDLFETIVVPRPTPGWFRLGRYLVRGSWRVLRSVRDGNPNRSYDRALGLFAPAATVALLVTWLAALIVGYGLLMYALRDELQPVPPDLGTAIYFAATSLLTIGFGDIVAVGAPARVLIITAAVGGLGAVALVVTFLFSLYGSYQRREAQVDGSLLGPAQTYDLSLLPRRISVIHPAPSVLTGDAPRTETGAERR